MQGVKKKSKEGQQRAEDRAEQSRSFPRAARPLGMQKQRKSADEAGLCHTCFQYSSNGTNQHGPTLLQQCMHQIWPVCMCSAVIKDKVTRLHQTKVYSVTSLQTPCLGLAHASFLEAPSTALPGMQHIHHSLSGVSLTDCW